MSVENTTNQPGNEEKGGDPQSRYMSQMKKRYYLASVDENVEMLRKEQINDLTKVLIGLKSEYDNLVRESTMVKKETQNISKKIALLERMDNITKQKSVELVEKNITMKEAIEVKRRELNEEIYNKKTLVGIIEKIKNDNFLFSKEVADEENLQIKLKSRYQKEKLFENDIKEKHNSIFNKITNQKKKNNFDKNEYELQLQYYQTIIEQKWMFIQSADERKERQRKIAQEAKNDSHDKQEIDKRHILHLLYLMDKYLKCKMEKKLKENAQIEDVFMKIKAICGTSNLKTMVDTIIYKDKRYNFSISQITEKEKKKQTLLKEIKDLEGEFEAMKSEVVVNEDTVEDKNIKTIKTLDADDTVRNNLINEEKELNENYRLLQELHQNIVLKYDQVILNIKKMTKEMNNSLTSSPKQKENTTIMANSEGNTEPNGTGNSSSILKEEENIIASYAEYLANTEKTIDMLFLCHSKHEFLNMIREKGLEDQKDPLNRTRNKLMELKQRMVSSSRKSTNRFSSRYDEEYDYHGNDENGLEPETKMLQDEIFNKYMNNINMVRENFIKNEKDKKDKKKK